MAAGETHLIIVGGISVNDPGGHDTNPYNFMNPAGMWARKYKAADPGASVVVIVFAPPYETRAFAQKKEDSRVTIATKCEMEIFGYCMSESRNTRHFLDVMAKQASGIGFTVIEVRTRDELTDAIKRQTKVVTLDYFGHSNDKAMFPQYSTGVSPGRAEVMWDLSDARKVPGSIFAPNAKVRSFGCNQGDPGGLVEQMRDLWGVDAYGSEGQTQYAPIGKGEPIPDSNNGYYKYPVGGVGSGSRVPVTPGSLKTVPPP